jgi:hypothetical protein
MKKSRLLEIIREEISSALGEAATTYAGKTAVDDLKKDKAFSSLTGDAKTDALEKLGSGGTVTIGEEDQLNEIEQLAEMASMVQLKNQLEKQGKSDELEAVKAAEQTTIDKLKANPEFSGEGKNIRLKGYVKNLKKELKDTHGIDLQVLLSQVAAQAEKAGEDFKDDIATNTIEKNAAAQVLGTEKSKPGPQSSNKSKEEPKAKTEKAPKAEPKKAEEEDDEVAAATKAISGDETAKDLGKTSSIADKFANLFNVKTTEEAKEKMKELAKKANSGDQKAKAFFDDEKNKKIIQSYRKAQKVNA